MTGFCYIVIIFSRRLKPLSKTIRLTIFFQMSRVELSLEEIALRQDERK
jgi:hypothetical protein